MPTDSKESAVRPLSGLRVLDLTDSKGEMCARFLADLGADVVYVEPPEGARARQQPPLIDSYSLYFATHNANKRGIMLDLHLEGGKQNFLSLLKSADILVESGQPGYLASLGLSPEYLLSQNPRLTVLSISDFGQTGPYSGYQATNAVHMTMAGMVARSGLKGRYPLLPPGSNLAYETTAIQAAWVALLSYWQSMHTNQGGYMDFSVFEAATQVLDPGLGVTGSAAGGRSAKELVPRGRPPSGKGYPIFSCADGHVRICVLNPRQWQGMSSWLGGDHPYTDPSFAKMSVRFQHMRDINALIAKLFKSEKSSDLVREGRLRGVPIAVVATPEQVFNDDHFNARNTFSELEVASGITGRVPNGYVEINGSFCGVRTTAPAIGQHNEEVFNDWLAQDSSGNSEFRSSSEHELSRRPLEGIRVLDLGVIVAGAELGRLLSDQGAEVIKIENHQYPDGLRQSLKNEPMTESFAQGNRGKRSIGLNLRSDKGKELFKALIAKSDIVLSNFKPGTMESLGFGYDILKGINPEIIVADSSALGSRGPMSKSMGYGPLVRASTGLTGLWRYPDDTESFSDAVTIIPDHFAARASAVAVLSLLIRRKQTGEGGTLSLSQAEAILTAMSDDFLRESLQPGSLKPRGNASEYDAPNNLFPCIGDDNWCFISVRNDDDWLKLCGAIDRKDLAAEENYSTASGRLNAREELERQLSNWTKTKTPKRATELLQAAGVPAGFMQRLDEYEDNPHYLERNFFRTINQTGIPESLVTENAPVSFSHLPDPDIRPAPLLAEHTEEVAREILGLTDAEIDELVSSGDLERLKTTE